MCLLEGEEESEEVGPGTELALAVRRVGLEGVEGWVGVERVGRAGVEGLRGLFRHVGCGVRARGGV